MYTGSSRGMIGRDAEENAIRAFVDQVADGPGALVLAGEAGIGKTALLHAGVTMALQRQYQVLSCAPAEAEARLSFASLTDLLANAIDDEVRAALPGPQRDALDMALLLETPGAGGTDQRTTFTGVLSVLRKLAARSPVLVTIDDVQWVDADSASAIGFAVRRLRDEDRVGILANLRTPEAARVDGFLDRDSRFPTLRIEVGPLDARTIGRIIKQRLSTELPINVLRKIHGLSEGNPLFSLEIARAIIERTAPLQLRPELVIPSNVHDTLRARLALLSDSERRILLLMSALAHPTVSIISAVVPSARAGLRQLAIAGLVNIQGDDMRFSHPLFASSIYGDASMDERRGVHRDLSAVVSDPEERARHIALGASERDERVARLVEEGAVYAWRRGAMASAAELFELAARLTPAASSEEIAHRLMHQADALFLAGEEHRSLEVLRPLEEQMPAGAPRAEARLQLASVLFAIDPRRAVRTLAEGLEDDALDLRLRSRILSELAWYLFVMGALVESENRAQEAVELAESSADTSALAVALSTLADTRFELGRPGSLKLFQRAISLEDHIEARLVIDLPSFAFAEALEDMDELDRSRPMLKRLLTLCEERGDDHSAGQIRIALGREELRGGNGEAARAHLTAPTTALVGSWPWITALVAHADALLGHIDAAREAARGAVDVLERADFLWPRLDGRQAAGFIEASVEDHEMAVRYLEPAWELLRRSRIGEPGTYRFPADLAESLIAVGRFDDAERIIAWLAERGQVLERSWATGAAARCRGLLLAAREDLPGALSELERASEMHRQVGVPFELGRTLLALGRAARRAKRKRQARDALDEAARIFERLPAPVWASRARNELTRISGRRPAPGRMTPTEERVARLAAAGRTNREIADALFVSVRTVESHLSRIYAKLGLRSRTQLAAVLQASPIPQ